MSKLNPLTILLIAIILSIALTSCKSETERQKEYEKCTAACIGAIETGFGDGIEQSPEGEFVTIELCRRECAKKFLE